jgi:GIY-YIG catalytic domain
MSGIAILNGEKRRRGASRSEGPRHHERKTYCVYIITNRCKTLYIGITNTLERRMWEHKHGSGSELAACHKLDRLVYYASFDWFTRHRYQPDDKTA